MPDFWAKDFFFSLKNPFGKISAVKDTAEELFFPNHCPVCDRVQPRGRRICPGCSLIPKPVRPPVCEKCGKHIDNRFGGFCYDCLRNPREFDRGFALYEYSSIHDSVSTFKNLGRPEYGEYYGEMMGRHFLGELRGLCADALIPIPLHPEKMRKRGYNQAEILANAISRVTGIPVVNNLLLRPKKTRVQKHLKREERRNNMKKAFHISRNDVKLKTVILVDDIYTTGNTIGAAAAVCRGAGVESIFFITLATGRGYSN